MKPDFERQIEKMQREHMLLAKILAGAIFLTLIATAYLVWGYECK